MGLQPLYYAPGICKTSSPYSSGKVVEYGEGRIATGRYIDCLNVRFTAGFPEKLGGWVNALIGGTTNLQTTGTPRAVCPWRDNTGTVRTAIGTDTNLFAYDGTNIIDITPLSVLSIVNGSGANPLSTSNGSSIVTLSIATNPIASAGDWVAVTSTADVGGLDVNGVYQVTGTSPSSSNPSTISFDVLINATSGATGGGTVTCSQVRKVLPGSSFTTTAGSTLVTVTYPNHGRQNGDNIVVPASLSYNNFNGGSWYGQQVIFGVGTNIFSFNMNTPATTTGVVTTVADPIFGFLLTINPYQTTNISPQVAPTPGWTLAKYGQQMLACPINGTIYVYDPTQLFGPTKPLANAPSNILAMFVTPERFVVALGIGDGGLEIGWADQNDYTNWTTTTVDTAESGRTLQGGTYFVGGIPVRDGVSLIFTDKATFQMNYSGDSFIYDTPIVSDNSGLIGPHAAVAVGENAYWMSDKDFWSWTGTAQVLPSDDIRDYVFGNINRTYQSKCWAWSNRGKREVWFFYPTGTNTECDSYVIYHYDQQCWTIGVMNRTAGSDADLFSVPFACNTAGYLFYHETGVDAAGSAMDSYVTAAPLDVSNGDQNIDLFAIVPDFERLTGNILVTILSQYFPNDTIVDDGPYTLTDVNSGATVLDLRTDGKLIGYKIESNVLGGDFSLGLSRVQVQPSGARL